MARIQSAQLCELAFLDKCNRLCLIGVTTHHLQLVTVLHISNRPCLPADHPLVARIT